MEVRVFEHAVEERDELSHRGGQRHHGHFSGGVQALVKLAQDAVLPLASLGRFSEAPPQAELECVLGNGDAGVQGGDIGHTHTCKCEPGAMHPRPLIQRFEFGATDVEAS